MAPVEGFDGLAIRRIERLQAEAAPRARRLAYKPEDTTPLTETLADWRTRYGLTSEESEVLFNVALDVLPTHHLAALSGVTGDVIHARGVAVAAKTETRSVTHAALALVREALGFATFDWERKLSKREEEDTDTEDDDG